MAKLPRNLPPAGLSVPEVMQSTGLSRQKVYDEINSGSLRSFKVGRRRLISPAAIDAWVRKLEKGAA